MTVHGRRSSLSHALGYFDAEPVKQAYGEEGASLAQAILEKLSHIPGYMCLQFEAKTFTIVNSESVKPEMLSATLCGVQNTIWKPCLVNPAPNGNLRFRLEKIETQT